MYDASVLMMLWSFLGALVFVFAAVWVLTIIAYWRMFTKAGEKGWKVIIPVYSSYKIYTLVWKGYMFWISFAATFLAIFLTNLPDVGMGVLLLALAAWVVSLVLQIMVCFKMSRAFGHGWGYGFGLLFLYTIFILILGFGKSQYIGSQD